MIDVGEVAMVPIEDILVEDRAREELGDIEELKNSMTKRGLIQPLAVKHRDGKYQLLAGERRSIVLREAGNKLVPVRIYPDDIPPLEMKSIELAENFYRKDFEFWESDDLIREIHELQQEIHGKPAMGPREDGDGWGIGDTAKMAGVVNSTVSTAIKRSEAREAFPELFADCKSQSDATKIIKKVSEEVTKEAIAQRIEAGKAKTKTTKLANCYMLKDFFKGVEDIDDGTIHLVEIDPPYAIDLMKAKKSDGESVYAKDNYNEVPTSDYQVFLAKTFAECYRVMADHSWLICWFAPEPWFEVVYQELNNAGFSTTRMCGIWTKGYGQTKRPEIHLANTYEMFFYAWKGRPALNKAGHGNEFKFPPVPPTKKTHPTERPVELMREIYDTFAFPGSRVLIPFLGSGNGIIAANDLKMSALGFELSKGYRDSFLVKVHNME